MKQATQTESCYIEMPTVSFITLLNAKIVELLQDGDEDCRVHLRKDQHDQLGNSILPHSSYFGQLTNLIEAINEGIGGNMDEESLTANPGDVMISIGTFALPTRLSKVSTRAAPGDVSVRVWVVNADPALSTDFAFYGVAGLLYGKSKIFKSRPLNHRVADHKSYISTSLRVN